MGIFDIETSKQDTSKDFELSVLNRLEYLKYIARELIINYIKNNINDKTRLNEEIARINKIIDSIPIFIKEDKLSLSIMGGNVGNRIIICVNDINKFLQKGIDFAIATIIHELYHSISKNASKKRDKFLEEGYVVQITAETIRYAIENPNDIENIKKEDLVNALKNCKDNYKGASEFVRSTQIIMRQYGYNGMLEYIFSERSVDRLCKIAQTINSEFADILKKQCLKTPVSGNHSYERDFFRSMFNNVSLLNLSETDIEDNVLLQEYLMDSGMILENPKLRSYIIPSYKAYRIFNKREINISQEELYMQIKEELDKINFEYETQDDRIEDTNKMYEIIHSGYEKSDINPRMFDTKIYFAKFIAFDFYQRGIKQPIKKEQINEYICKIYSQPVERRILLEMVYTEINRIYEQAEKGIKISNIINETIANQTLLGILSNEELNDVSNNNYWEKVKNVANLTLEQKEKNGDNFYILFYNTVLEMTKKYISFSPDKIYNEKDYEQFKNKMNEIFDIAGVPVEFMNKIGLSVDKIYLRAISENLNGKNKSEQIRLLLELIKNNNMDLGDYTADLQEFAFGIYEVYEELKNQNNPQSINNYMFLLLEAYYNKGLYRATRIDDLTEDSNMKFVLFDFGLNPDFYINANSAMQIFQKYPQLYEMIVYNRDFYEKLINYLPKEMKTKLEGTPRVMMYNINELVIGKKFPKVEEMSEDKFRMVGSMVKFFIIYDKYVSLIENRHKDEAKKLWIKFYVKDKQGENNCDIEQNCSNP